MTLASKTSHRVVVTLGTCTALLLLAGTAAARDLEPARPQAQGLFVGASSRSSAASSAEDLVPTPGRLPRSGAEASTTNPSSTTVASTASTASTEVPIPRPSPTARGTTTLGPVVTTPLDRPTSSPPVSPGPPDPSEWPPLAVVEGPGSWSISAEGIAATLRMSPTRPRVGEVVHFSMTATYGRLGCCIAVVYPGDGTRVLALNETHRPCFETPAGHFSLELDHIYTEPGPVQLQFQPTIIVCQLPQPLPANFRGMISANLFAPFDVQPAA